MSPETTPFQVASLVNSPMFPNSVVWSEDNLIAVATGDIVTIMVKKKLLIFLDFGFSKFFS